MSLFETVAARATAPGAGAVGIIRLSGPKALEIADGIFFPKSGRLSDRPVRTAVFGELRVESGALLDVCLALCFKAPESFTGEDVVELQCHGGAAVMDGALSLCLKRGARLALPGEFTKRAFLNGRLSLSQAEAVADLVHARTEEAARNSASQLAGAMNKELEELYDALLGVTAHLAAWIDYTEEGVDPPDLSETAEALGRTAERCGLLAATFEKGRALSEGVPCAICGRPNAGKSSLLNALAGYERAIVSPVAGTTRDTVDVEVNLNGALLRLTDTAGLRNARGGVERQGVERSKKAIAGAGLALVVLDGGREFSAEDEEVLALADGSGAKVVCVVSKSDLPRRMELSRGHICVSTVTGEGMSRLKDRLYKEVADGSVVCDGSVISNRRQAEALARAAASADSAKNALTSGMTPDVAWVDAEAALEALGEVSGRSVSEEVLVRVFERFCVGK